MAGKRIALLLALCGGASVSVADTVAAGPGVSDAKVLEEIVVTSRRRPERLRSVPVAVSAFDERALTARQIDSADRLGDFVPNLTFDKVAPSSGSGSVGQIFIRGIGQTDFTPVTDPGVALYVDGVYLARSPGNVLDLIDIERVEVLRGPQGTLFGRNSIGGAIKVHSVRPDSGSRYASIEGRVGSDELRALAFKGNLPLSDNLAGNLSLFGQQRDGYVTRSADGLATGDRDRWAARAALRWYVTTDVEMTLAIDYSSVDENGAPSVSGGVNDLASFGRFGNALLESCGSVAINPAFDGTAANGPPSFPPPGVPAASTTGCVGPLAPAASTVSDGTHPVFSRLATDGVLLEVDWSAHANWLLESTTGFRRMTMQSSRDADNTAANVFATYDDYDHRQLTQEFRAHYEKGTITFLAGVFYLSERGFNLVDVTLPTGAIRSGGYYDNESAAAFAHVAKQFADRYELAVGARHTHDDKGYRPDQISLGDASAGPAGDLYAPTWPALEGFYLAPTGPLAAGERILDDRRSRIDFGSTDVTVSLRAEFTEAFMGYASYSTGYKSGGFDQRFVGPTADRLPTSYAPETVESIELGAKLTAGRLRANVSVFDANYDDLQIIVRESFNPLTVNAGTARVRGAEFEATWANGRNFESNLSLAYLDAGYRQLSESAIASGVELDNAFVNAPRRSASLGVAYALPEMAGGRTTLRADWLWSDEQYHDAINSDVIRQGAYGVFNAQLRFESRGQRWAATLSGRNLLDKRFLVTGNSAFDTAAAYVERVYDRGRELQFAVRYDF